MGLHHNHSHNRHHHVDSVVLKNIKIALLLNLSFACIEFVGGIWVGSIAVISDALHDLGDSLSLALALFAEKIALKQPTKNYSYGFRRYSLASALITGIILLVSSIFVLQESISRLAEPKVDYPEGMFFLGLLGVAVNGYAAYRLKQGKTQNEKVITWHLLEDLFGWIAILIGSLIIAVFDAPIVDPILSIAITLFVLRGVFISVSQTTRLFLQAVPPQINMETILGKFKKLQGVLSTHDEHIWSLDGDRHVMSIHVVTPKSTSINDIISLKQKIRKVIAEESSHMHLTIEVEFEGEDCPDLNCV